MTDWTVLNIGESIEEKEYKIQIPSNLNEDAYDGKIKVSVEAYQYNAFSKVNFVNNDGSLIKQTVAPIGKGADFIGEEPTLINNVVPDYDYLPEHYDFEGWDKVLSKPVYVETTYVAQYKETIDGRLRFAKHATENYFTVSVDQSYKKDEYIAENNYTITIPETFRELDVVEFTQNDVQTDSYIKDMRLAESIEVIGKDSFKNWNSLKSITLGNILSIGENAFLGCDKIDDVYLKGVLTDWFGIELENKYSTPTGYGSNLYFYDEGIKSYFEYDTITVPENVDNVDYQLRGIKNIRNIIIGEQVKTIAKGALFGTKSLESLSIPFIGSGKATVASKDTLAGYIFGEENYDGSIPTTQYYSEEDTVVYHIPEGLTSLTVGGNFEEIYHGALSNFSNLEFLSIGHVGDSIKVLGENVLYGCSSLKEVIVPFVGSNINIGSVGVTT